MSLIEIHDSVERWMQAREPWAEAVLVGVRRSAPRAPGARFAVSREGSTAGSISAGCVEADLREHMMEVLEAGGAADPRVVSYGITDEMALGVGLACGGEIDVLICRHDPDDVVWSSLTGLFRGAAGTRAQAALLTGLSADVLGRQILVHPGGDLVGSLGDPAADRLIPPALDDLFAREGGESLDLGTGLRVFADRILPPRRLVIVGAGPALSVMAPAVGYRVTVVDPRPALTASEAFADIDIRVGWPAEVLAEEGLDEWTDVAVLAHDERIDVEALVAAIQAGCRYVGLLGGSRTQGVRREALISAGVSPADAARIRGPIGLDIGAATPAEIAASILAEMIAVRRLGQVQA